MMKRIVLTKLVAVVMVMLGTVTISAGAVRYWVGTGNWNVAANWSATSGTAGGVGVPVPGDDVIFDANGLGPCTINAVVSVGTFSINGYTSTITQNGTLTVISTFNITSGTFSGGAFTTTLGSFSQTGGLFTIAGPTTINGNTTLASGTFNQLAGAPLLIKGSMTMTSGVVNQGDAFTVYNVNTGAFTMAGGTFNGGTQNIKVGSYSQTGGTFIASSGVTQIAGNADFTGGALAFVPNGGVVDFHIGASGPALTITGTPALNDISFSSDGFSFYHTVTTPLVANTITIDLTVNSYVQLNIASTGSLRAKGDLVWVGNYTHQLTGGTIFVEKNIILNTNQANTTHPTNAATIEICGTVDQDIKSNVVTGYNILPNIRVNKPSGVLNLIGNITVSGPAWDVVSGTINPNIGTSTLYFYQPVGGTPITVSGDQTLGDVTILLAYSTVGLTILNNVTVESLVLNSNNSVKIQLSGTVTVNKNLYLTGTGTNGIVLRGGTIYAKGDIDLSATYTALDSFNTGTIEIVGTGAQTLTGTALGQCVLPNIVIDKPSGLLTISNTVTLQGSWTYKQGSVDAVSNFSTVFFTNYTTILSALPVIDGQGISTNMTFYNLRVSNPYPSSVKVNGALQIGNDLRVASGTTLDNSANYPITVNRNFTNAGTVSANGATIVIGGDFTNSSAASIINTSNGTVTISGDLSSAGIVNAANATYTFNGFSSQNISSAGGLAVSKLVVNKTSGAAVTLLSPVVVKAGGQLTLTNGTIVTSAANSLTLKDLVTTTIGSASSYVDGPMNYEIQSTSSRTLNFPIGKGGAWRPAELTVQHNSAATVFTYKGEVINASASALGLTLPAALERVSSIRYYDFNSNGASNLTAGFIKLYFGPDDEVNNLAKLGVAVGKAGSGMPTAWTTISAASPTGTCTLCAGFMTGAVVSTSFLPVVATSGITHQLFTLANTVAGTGINNALPIELSSFTVTAQSNAALLQWITEVEFNNDYFVIERAEGNQPFVAIGQVNGAGSVKTQRAYSWLDKNIPHGKLYYRLRQVDFDGKFTYSKVLNFYQQDEETPFVIYPLPVHHSLLYFSSLSTVRILDATGRTLSTHEQVEQVDVSHLASGMYYVINQKGDVRKMTIVR